MHTDLLLWWFTAKEYALFVTDLVQKNSKEAGSDAALLYAKQEEALDHWHLAMITLGQDRVCKCPIGGWELALSPPDILPDNTVEHTLD